MGKGKSGSRYDAKYSGDTTTAGDIALAVATAGLSTLLPDSVGCKVTNKETGETSTGWGHSRAEARNDAHSKFKK